jgi:hypothetical protein
MDAAQASPVSAWMAVSREQNDHPLVPRIACRPAGTVPVELGKRGRVRVL